MKKIKRVMFIFILSLLFISMPIQVQAEERNIYVGDLIELRIEAQEFSRDELIDKFKDFEIASLKEDNEGYVITLRSFETGEKKVQLGDKEIIIDIKSTLDEIERDGVFEGDLAPEEAGFYMEWRYVFYGLLIISLATGGIYLGRHLKKKKISSLSPIQHFMNQMERISLDDHQYFVKLTSYFKRYIEATQFCMIRGKTSSEIIDEISSMPGLSESLRDIKLWLEESDRLKFSGAASSGEERQKLHDSLVYLVRKVEELKGSGA